MHEAVEKGPVAHHVVKYKGPRSWSETAVVVAHPACSKLGPKSGVVVRGQAGHDFKTGRDDFLFELFAAQPIFEEISLARHDMVDEAVFTAAVDRATGLVTAGPVTGTKWTKPRTQLVIDATEGAETGHGNNGDTPRLEHAQVLRQWRAHAVAKMFDDAEGKQAGVSIIRTGKGCDIADRDT